MAKYREAVSNVQVGETAEAAAPQALLPSTLSGGLRFVDPYSGEEEKADVLRANASDEELPEAGDAFEAAFFKVGRPAVLGSFGTVPDTSAYPWRAIAYLDIVTEPGTSDEDHWRGTGFLVSPHTLITAGHNVFLHDHGGWPKEILVHPGRNARGSPFGSFAAHTFYTTRGWMDGRSAEYDYGAIVLDTDIGAKLGYFGLLPASDTDFANLELYLAGYPNTSGEQVRGDGHSQSETNQTVVYYDVPTAVGQSGAPLWFRDVARAVAIHAYDSGAWNSGVRINEAVFTQLSAWSK